MLLRYNRYHKSIELRFPTHSSVLLLFPCSNFVIVGDGLIKWELCINNETHTEIQVHRYNVTKHGGMAVLYYDIVTYSVW